MNSGLQIEKKRDVTEPTHEGAKPGCRSAHEKEDLPDDANYS